MNHKGRVITIFVAPTKGAPMEEVAEVWASTTSGLEGDRYGKDQGSWSTPGKTHRQITLIAAEAITLANKGLDQPYGWRETRRNIVTQSIDLNTLVGRTFWVGTALLRYTKASDPCDRPDHLSGKKGFKQAFDSRGGICAEILIGGLIRKNDTIDVELLIEVVPASKNFL